MSKRVFVGVMVGAIAVALATGGLLASNMGFKLNYSLKAADGGVSSKSGSNTLALPFNQQTGLATAKNLMDDIGFASVASVAKLLKASDAYQTYTGRKGSPGADFNLASGEAYVVQMSADVDYIVVGSHDPSLAVTLSAADGGTTSKSGSNLFAYPYHSTAGTAKQLMDDIGFANVASVAKLLKASDAYQTYTGRKGSPGADFTLAPGEGYVVQMSSTVSYVPSHY